MPNLARPDLAHAAAIELQRTELTRTIDFLRSLTDDDWQQPTECPGWTVHLMYLHVLGACEAGASMRENIHQLRAARRHRRENGGPLEAALSAVQIRDRQALAPAQLVERLSVIAPRTVKKRRQVPALVRRARLAVDGPVVEKWTLGYLSDVIYLRDLWMHRVDATRATGRELEVDADHDGAIVADVVAEWQRRHGANATLVLTGVAGGTFGTGDPVIERDAIEFCRTLAGRSAADHPLLTTIVPF